MLISTQTIVIFEKAWVQKTDFNLFLWCWCWSVKVEFSSPWYFFETTDSACFWNNAPYLIFYVHASLPVFWNHVFTFVHLLLHNLLLVTHLPLRWPFSSPRSHWMCFLCFWLHFRMNSAVTAVWCPPLIFLTLLL